MLFVRERNLLAYLANPTPISSVPEPTSLTLFGVGTLGLAGWRLRRKHAPV